MAAVKANGIEIEYEDRGPRDSPVIVLIMGLGMQLIAWPDALCEGLVARGFRVIRFDNRDAGLSTKIPTARHFPMAALVALAFLRLPVRLSYTLKDMASDTLGLMDALGIARAHLVGASMGGMIGQIIAAEHPERVSSLISLFSTTGNRALPGPEPKVLRALIRRRRRNGRARAVKEIMGFLRLIGSPDYPTSDAELRAKVERSVARCYYPQGFGRQFLAILTAADRRPMLRRIRAPTLVLHGAEDPFVPPAAGADTAANIPGARLRIIPGMGHDLPGALVPFLAEAIVEHCLKAEDNVGGATARRAAGGSP
ncbi:MAG TPA: alpha/beta fold hydrolase [Roseiarcus sp.]|jgi:pimeloyl-ACP methyl ester carboxylesterase|nr:alpha/beta fold hydrolase [Roseiarcus sp.]